MTPPQTPDSYWSELVSRERVADMARKYGALLQIVSRREGPERQRELRAVAAEWPGALREAQLLVPERLRAREAAAREGAASAARSRAAWREAGHAGPVVWADLHLLLADQLSWRRAGRRGSFTAHAHSDAARGTWPDGETLAELGGAVHSRVAYRWLARRAGLTLPDLNALLFERTGHWDRRPGD